MFLHTLFGDDARMHGRQRVYKKSLVIAVRCARFRGARLPTITRCGTAHRDADTECCFVRAHTHTPPWVYISTSIRDKCSHNVMWWHECVVVLHAVDAREGVDLSLMRALSHGWLALRLWRENS